MSKKLHLKKVVDETTRIFCSSNKSKGMIREEVWQDGDGNVAKYNLAFINHSMYGRDNGRVLGYDNHHGEHHRHWMGHVEAFVFIDYESLLRQLLREISNLRDGRNV